MPRIGNDIEEDGISDASTPVDDSRDKVGKGASLTGCERGRGVVPREELGSEVTSSLGSIVGKSKIPPVSNSKTHAHRRGTQPSLPVRNDEGTMRE